MSLPRWANRVALAITCFGAAPTGPVATNPPGPVEGAVPERPATVGAVVLVRDGWVAIVGPWHGLNALFAGSTPAVCRVNERTRTLHFATLVAATTFPPFAATGGTVDRAPVLPSGVQVERGGVLRTLAARATLRGGDHGPSLPPDALSFALADFEADRPSQCHRLESGDSGRFSEEERRMVRERGRLGGLLKFFKFCKKRNRDHPAPPAPPPNSRSNSRARRPKQPASREERRASPCGPGRVLGQRCTAHGFRTLLRRSRASS